jgi:hypothetical protein
MTALFPGGRPGMFARHAWLSRRTRVMLHQIYYDDAQRPTLDRGFVPYDNRSNPDPTWREYHVFRSEYLSGRIPAEGITGYVSWKFGLKTGTTGRAFRAFIRRRPGHDVYCISPPGIDPLPFPNVWLQGEHHHPGILHLVRRVFQHVGVECDPETVHMPAGRVLYCNYWAGTRRFWDRYMAFCEPVRDCLLHGLDEADRRLLHSRADRLIDACYIPFIMERLFSTLLAVAPDISCASWEAARDAPPRRRWFRRRWAA